MTTKKDDISSIDNFRLNKAMILESFDAWTYSKGEGYFRNGAVVSWETKKKGIKGKVEGSWSPYYTTKLRIENGHLIGSCSCPLGFDCKHCVALALQWLEDKNNRSRKNITPNDKQLKLPEEDNVLKEELGTQSQVNKFIKIPLELKKNPIQNIEGYLQLFPRSDLENLVIFFMKEYTKTQEIMIFSPQFISMIWNSRLTQLDDDFNELKRKQGINDYLSPLTILEQIKDESAKVQCIKAWFEGYIDLIGHIKNECRLRGMLEVDGEEIYEYYKNKEYDRLEEEVLEESNERYNKSYNNWDHNDYDYLEPYEEFDLDTSTLKSYIEDFFNWILAPVEEICDYISYLHKYHLSDHQDYLIKEGIQWLKDLELPTAELGVDPKNFSALSDLKSVIVMKLSFLTTFSNNTDQINFLYSLFIQNPSQQNSELIWAQLHHTNPTEQSIQYFIEKLLKNFGDKPSWEKFDLAKRLILKHQPEFINSLLKVSIDCLFKNPDAGQVIKEVFRILEDHPDNMTLAMESELKQASLKVQKKVYSGDMNLYRETVDWLVNYYHKRKISDRAFMHLIELAKERPKIFEFRDYKNLREALPSLSDQLVSEYENVISLILKNGSREVIFRLLLDLENYDKACEMIKSFSSSTYSYLHHHDTQWGAITRLIPHISSITDKNKEEMIKVLKAQINGWLSHSSRNRPDASIAEAILQINAIYLAFKTQKGDILWEKWFKSFSNKHWRLRNLRSALKIKGFEMKKT